MPTNSQEQGSNRSSQVPPIRTFQSDSSSVGNLKSSVNLFRGDVNYSQNLFSLPGRRKALDVQVSLQYQSNVYREATTWNRDAPTGVVGLGWSLPSDAILVSTGDSPTAATHSYTYRSNGGDNALIRRPENDLLFTADGALAGSLQDGQAVPSDVRSLFTDRGLPMDASTLVEAAGDDSWTLVDGALQQLFDLHLDGTDLVTRAGGESYEMQNFQPWRIAYYPRFERWNVTKETGVVFSYGGLGQTTPEGDRTGRANSIAWNVQWIDADGRPLWNGDSALTHIEGERVQQQYASGWYLERIVDAWGDAVTYSYNGWPRDATGKIPDVEQRVGEDGLLYTKAIYLTELVDGFGRRVDFSYNDKLFEESTAEAPKEFVDPHRAVPSNQANAYQDRYETKFLARIDVSGVDADALFGVLFDYAPRPEIDGPERAVANVSELDGLAYGECYKRFLTAIRMTNPAGESQPGFRFDYLLDTADSEANLGALSTITYPQGGKATYAYEKRELPVCDRRLAIERPAEVSEGATPRIFFGDDYAVSTWYDAVAGRLTLRVYTWLGSWVIWQLEADDSTIFQASSGLDLSTLDVVARTDFFALRFDRNEGGASFADIYLFQKDTARPGRWVPDPAGVDGQPTGLDNPSLEIPTSSSKVTLLGGQAFLLISELDTIQGGSSLRRATFEWPTRSWTKEALVENSSQRLYPTVGGEYIAWIAYDASTSSATAYLEHLEPTLEWKSSEPLPLDAFAIPNPEDVAVAPGGSLVACSRLLQASTQLQVDYQLTLLQWDAQYRMRQAFDQRFTDPVPQNGQPTSWVPQIVSSALVAVAGHVLRFDGAEWLENSSLALPSPVASSQQLYAYGPDYAIQVYEVSGGATVQVLPFDPNTDSMAWDRSPIVPSYQPPVRSFDPATAYWPTAGGNDWLTVGNALYFRGTSDDWSEPLSTDPNDIVDLTIDSATMVDSGPTFLAFPVYDTADPTKDHVASVTLRNGATDPVESLPEERFASGGGAGRGPAGAGAFVTYPAVDSDFDRASELFVYRYAGDAVRGPIEGFPVVGLDFDNGFGEVTHTIYDPRPESAGCDASGQVVKYFESRVYPGATDEAAPAYGSVVNTYLNGLTLDRDHAFDMLDGLLSTVEVFDRDGAQIRHQRNEWQVFTERAGDPFDGSALPEPLHGGFVLQIGQTQTTDGVTTTTANEYVAEGFSAPYSSQIVRTQSTNVRGDGAPELVETVNRYAYEVYPTLAVLNALTPQSEVVTSHRTLVGSPVSSSPSPELETDGPAAGELPPAIPSQATATTYSTWEAALTGVRLPSMEARFGWVSGAFEPFPFETYEPGSTPEGWLSSQRVTARSLYGLVTESMDATGTVSSTRFDLAERFPVARVTNANIVAGECTYLAFEPYEDTSPWILTGTSSVPGDAPIGTTSLRLPGDGSASLAVTLDPIPGRGRPYVLGFWSKTPAGFSGGEGDGWSVEVTLDGDDSSVITIPFEDSAGHWRYATYSVPLPAPAVDSTSTLVLRATARNSSGEDVLLDGLWLGPVGSALKARTYEPSLELPTSVLDAAGRATRILYDRFHRPMTIVGPDGRTKETVGRFLSRAGNADDRFDVDQPNAELTVQAAQGGSAESFTQGVEWTERWQASNPEHWTVEGGSLAHTAASPDTLERLGAESDDLALAVEVITDGPLAGPLGFYIGDKARVQWDPAEVSWQLLDALGQPLAQPLGAPPRLASHWLLAVASESLLFWADGQLIFSLGGWREGATPVGIDTGPNELLLRNLTLLDGPRLDLSFLDGAGNQRQAQSFDAGDAVVVQSVVDPLGRQVAVTKAAPASFAGESSGASGAVDPPVLAYRPAFVDVPAFLASLNGTWRMEGEVADYYSANADAVANAGSATSSGAVGETQASSCSRSDDEGYPYCGTRYEASPRKVGVESGVAGKPYAIHDIDSTSEEQRRTTQFAYGPSEDADFLLDTVTTPRKSQACLAASKSDETVAAEMFDAEGVSLARSRGYTSYGDDPADFVGVRVQVLLPNSFTDSPQSDPEGYVGEIYQDPLQRIVQRQDPDSGTSRYIYDPAQRMRFFSPQLEQTEAPYYLYSKFDGLGRIVEEGAVDGAWDAAALQSLANVDPEWPSASSEPPVSFSRVRSYTYDGDGSDANALGGRQSSTTTQPEASSSVVETYTYDRFGQVASIETRLDDRTFGVDYSYDNLGEVIRIDYPEGSTLGSVGYDYDQRGRVRRITADPETSPSVLAEYLYDPEGEVCETRFGDGLTASYGFDSPGWLSSIELQKDGEAEARFRLGYAYDYDGTPKQIDESYAFAEGGDESRSTTYTFDGLRRLRSATPDGGEGRIEVQEYDADGNIWTLEQDGIALDLTCVGGSNRLASSSLGGGVTVAADYDGPGRMTAAPTADGSATEIRYDRVLGLADRITPAAQDPLELTYASQGQRVRKQKGEEVTYYAHGLSSQPLYRDDDGTPSAYVYGPTGLVSVVRDQAYFPLHDLTGSARVVVDSSGGLVARYDYLPFGGTLAAGGPQPEVLDYRFGGQELDLETGFYNFGARLYDPFLRRFHAPDPERQFASPYVFAGDDPLTLVDPSGRISVWAQVGIGAAMVGVAAAGLALSFVTVGASDAAAAGAEATLAGAVAGEAAVAAGEASAAGAAGAAEVAAGAAAGVGEAAAAGGAEAAGATAAAAGGEAVAAGGEAAALAGEVAGEAGAAVAGEAGAASSAASSLGSNLANVGIKTASGAIQGAGWNGLSYDMENGRDFTAKGFFTAVGIGAAAGAASGFVGSALKMPQITSTVAERFGLGSAGSAVYQVLASGVAGVVKKDVSLVLTNYSQGLRNSDLTGGLVKASVSGFGKGVGSGALSVAGDAALANTKIAGAVDALKQVATSQQAYGVYMTTGFVLVSGYAAWGAADDWGR